MEEWIRVAEWTYRLKVDGGHLYRNIETGNCMCFVPDVDLARYQAHLRDAYNQGFQDGATDAHSQYHPCLKTP